MRKVTLLINVSDSVYSDVVEPRKREKSFTSFMESLLDAYYTNPAMQAVVEGSIDGAKEESMKSLSAALMKAQSSMSRLALFADELESTNQEGINAFSGNDDSDSSGIGDFTDLFPPAQRQDNVPMRDYELLKEEVTSLKSQNAEIKSQNDQILLALRNLAQQGIQSSQMSTSKEAEVQISSRKEEPKEEPIVLESSPVIITQTPEPSTPVQATTSVPVSKATPAVPMSESTIEEGEMELIDFGIDFDAIEAEGDDAGEDTINEEDLFASFMQDNQFTF